MQNNSRDLGSSSSGESINVFVRVRPPDLGIGGDANAGNLCLEISSPSTLTMHSQPEPRVFTFDHVAGPETTQVDVFSAVGRPIIDSCMAGYNGTIFAYGQTGSGKTFTMIGPADEGETFTHELRGVIPRSFEYLFSLINREKIKLGELVEHLCKCSFLEIYNEQVYDLLDPASAGLHLRESIKRGVYVDGLIEEVVTSAAEAYQVLSRGWINRRVASTSMNRESSRSHAVFILAVESKKKDSSNSVSKIRTSLLNLVDLAGSERQRDTQSVGLRLKEAGSINRSLSALGNVIMALVEIAHGKSRHVHYRDSKLTFLLRDSLGGNAKTNLIANVHPIARCFGETLSTLQFARRAKMIKNKAVVNEDTTGNVPQLQLEIRRLREIINKFKNMAPQVSGTPMQSSSTLPLLDQVGVEFSGGVESAAVSELKEMLAMSMRVREKSEADKMLLIEKIEKLENLCKRKDRSLQSSKMILKLRDSHIASLEGKREDIRELNRDDLVKLLRSEIEQLKLKIEHHPEVTKFAKDNLDLRADKKRLEEMVSGAGQEQRREISRLRQYTLQLERQLHPYLQGTKHLSVAESSSTSGQLARLTEEVDSLRDKAKQLQRELDESRENHRQDEENHQQTVGSLEARLGVANRTQQELEKTIEALHVKHTLERTSMNTSHLRMIKALVTPMSARRAKSSTSTPAQRQQSKGDDQLRQKLFFAPLSEIQPQQAQTEDIESPLLTSPLQLHEDGGGKGEGDMGDALGEELTDFKETNCHLQKQLEVKESQLLQMSSRQTELESRVLEATQLHEKERESARNQEQFLRNKVSQLSSENTQLKGDKTVLVDEIQDLKLCLQSADRELVEVKAEFQQEKEQAKSKSAELYLRIGELEQQMSAKSAEWERSLEGLQNLQDELETLREEAVFKQHCLEEREESLQQQKEVAKHLEQQIQALEEQIEMEKEKITLVTSQLEEGSRRELAAALDENGHLMTELNKLRNDMQQQLTLKQNELDSAQASILALTKRAAEDKEALAELMATVQAMRAKEMEQESREAALRREGEEKGAQLAEETAKKEELSSQLEEMYRKMENTTATHKNEIKMKDMQYELLADEMTEKLHELSHTCNIQSTELLSAQDAIKSLQKEVDDKQLEVQRLQQLLEEKASPVALSPATVSSAQLLSPDDHFDCILHLETELANRNDLIRELQEEKDAKLQELQMELDGYVKLKRNFELLQTKQLSQQYRLEADSEEFKNKEAMLKEQLSIQECSLESARTALSSLLLENEKLQLETQEVRKSYDSMAERAQCLEQQMERVRAQEEDVFQEKENLCSQLETVKEEKAKLAKENKELVKENAQLSGHRNLQQRIQYHAKLKLDYHKLIEEHQQLKEQMQLREDYIHALQEELAKSGNRDSTHLEKLSSRIRMQSKENIQPC